MLKNLRAYWQRALSGPNKVPKYFDIRMDYQNKRVAKVTVREALREEEQAKFMFIALFTPVTGEQS